MMAHARRDPAEPAAGPRALLASRGLRAKKHFGQNFLADRNLAARIAELATDPPGGSVVEIGAGLGALTEPLLERGARVFAIERDRDLVPLLRQELAPAIESGALTILEADAKAVDPLSLLEGCPRPRVLAGNLPYQLTGPLLEQATRAARGIDRAVILVQLEVADRLTAGPGTASWGALSIFVQAQFALRRAFVVRRGAFHPQPGVDSAVVVLEPHAVPIAEETPAFRALVHAAFAQRRKKLKNAWAGVLGLEPAEVAAAAERARVDLEVRGETLAIADFARMAREVSG
jgi:16S rRNA (adenine1518-N6/adenine1519-N6)-dimethyltransferase